jgi:hypothetical protein
LSDFGIGLAMMRVINGAPHDQESRPIGKILHTYHLLLTAALIMSLFLLSTSLITTLLIPADGFRSAGVNGEPAGPANGRPAAYLAHQFLCDGLGTVYDGSIVAVRFEARAASLEGKGLSWSAVDSTNLRLNSRD